MNLSEVLLLHKNSNFHIKESFDTVELTPEQQLVKCCLYLYLALASFWPLRIPKNKHIF